MSKKIIKNNDYLPFDKVGVENLIKPFIKSYKTHKSFKSLDDFLVNEFFDNDKLIEFCFGRGEDHFFMSVAGYHHTLPDDWEESLNYGVGETWKYEYNPDYYLEFEFEVNDDQNLNMTETVDLFLYEFEIFWKKLNKMWSK